MKWRTSIEWCDYTWNPWTGCTKVSPGCLNCYAERLVTTRLRREWGKGKPRTKAGGAILKAPYLWNKRPWICDECGEALPLPVPHGKSRHTTYNSMRRARVFLGSLMDIFDEEVPIEWFANALLVVYACRELDFLLVTKRPQNAMKHFAGALRWSVDHASPLRPRGFVDWLDDWCQGVAPKNVWMITSAEDQKRLDERIPSLMSVPAVVHGISAEPLLGSLDLSEWFKGMGMLWSGGMNSLWTICGGESGPDSRPCDVFWLDDLRKQCKAAGVAFFCKQLGHHVTTANANLHEWPDTTKFEERRRGRGAAAARVILKDLKGGDVGEFPDELRVRQWPQVSR